MMVGLQVYKNISSLKTSYISFLLFYFFSTLLNKIKLIFILVLNSITSIRNTMFLSYSTKFNYLKHFYKKKLYT